MRDILATINKLNKFYMKKKKLTNWIKNRVRTIKLYCILCKKKKNLYAKQIRKFIIHIFASLFYIFNLKAFNFIDFFVYKNSFCITNFNVHIYYAFINLYVANWITEKMNLIDAIMRFITHVCGCKLNRFVVISELKCSHEMIICLFKFD